MSNKKGRRGFFKEALHQVLQPVAELLDEQVGERLIGATLEKESLQNRPSFFLRPPGALHEAEFLEKCLRCGNCVKNCPADAIMPMESKDETLAQTPYINPDVQPCVICDALACMYVCPSGALQSVFAEDIAMGIAVFTAETCLRTKDISCTYCVDNCPIGAEAIHFSTTGLVEVIIPGCTGCGVCQYVCPTDPKSIIVEPQPLQHIGSHVLP